MLRLVLLLGLAVPTLASAQTRAAPAAERKTVITFEPESVSGQGARPMGEVVTTRPVARHSGLIRERTSFRDQVLDSVKELR